MSNNYTVTTQNRLKMIVDKNKKCKMEPYKQFHLEIGEDAFKRGHFEAAEELILMYNDNSERANNMLKEIRKKILQGSEIEMPDNSELDRIRDDPSMPAVSVPEVKIDPEKQMLKNTIVMRVRLLILEGRLSYSNRAENDLEMFDDTKLPRFYDHMKDVGLELNKTIASFDAENFDDANIYLEKAEELFLELCPERLRKKAKKSDGASNNDNILKDVKPKDYQPLPRDELTVKGNWEDIKKCLNVAAKAMAEHKYDKAKRMAEKAERIHETPAAKALLEQIRIVTEAREEAAERAKEKALQDAAQKAIDEEKAAKAAADKAVREAAKRAVEKAKKEATRSVSNHQYNSKACLEKGQEALEMEGSENARKPSGAESLKRNADLGPDQVSPDAVKKRRAEGMMSVAQQAFSAGDMSKAEKLAKKAQKLNPSEETDKVLEEIRKKTSQTNTEKKQNVDPNVIKKTSENLSKSNVQSEKITTLLNKAKACFASRHLDDAEQALKDVRDCHPHPIEDVESLESQIRAARASRSSTENAHMSYPDVKTSHPEENPNDRKYRAKKNAESLIGIARNAMTAGEYEKAEKFLKKASAEYPSGVSEKLLQDVQIELYSKDAKKSNDNKNCDAGTKNKDNSFVENMAKAESLYNQAKKELSNKNFDEAMDLAVNSQKLNRLAKVEGLKKDIIKARNRSGNVESAKVNNCDNGASKVGEAFDLITQAKTELKDKNLTKAEQLLGQSIEIHGTESAHGLLNEIRQRKSEPKHDQNTTINYGPTQNHDEAQKCMKIAEAAAKDKDFKKAEHFLEKSIRLSPSIEAREMLESVRVYLHGGKPQANSESQHMSNDRILTHEVHNNEKDHGYLKADVEKCIEVAMNAISAEDFEKAERFLKKAKRIQPTEKAKELLEEVQKGLDDRKKEEQARLANEEKAEPLVSFAMTAIDKELYEFAEILLMNAWIKHKSGTAEKLIMQVRDIVAQADAENTGKDKKKNNKDSTQILDQQKGIAEECIKTARRMVSEGQLESAECVLIIAHNTYATNQASEMLTSIRYEVDFNSSGEQCRLKTKEWKFSKISKEGIKKRDAFKCNIYVHMAQRAYETGDFKVAKEFLLEAERLVPSKDIKKLIKQVEEASKPKSSKKNN